MADTYWLIKANSNCYPMQNRTWSVGDQMYRNNNDFGSNATTHGAAWLWECTTGGTSTGNPTWPTSLATQDVTTVTQNGVVWVARRPGRSSGTTLAWSHAAPHTLMVYKNIQFGYSPQLKVLSGDRWIVCVDDAFAESNQYYQAIGYADDDRGLIIMMSVDSDAGLPPLAVSPGAKVMYGCRGINYGMSMKVGVYGMCINCTASIDSTGGAPTIDGFMYGGTIDATNAFASQKVSFVAQESRIVGVNFIQGAATLGALFNTPYVSAEIDGLDLSTMNASTDLFDLDTWQTVYGPIKLRNVRLPASWTGQVATAIFSGSPTYSGRANERGVPNLLSVVVSGAAGNSPIDYTAFSSTFDKHTNDTGIYRSNGAVEHGVEFSRKVVAADYVDRPAQVLRVQRAYPGNAAEDAAWSAGASKTFTFHLIHDSATNLQNDELWIHATVADVSGYNDASFVNGGLTDLVNGTPADLAASSETWVGTGGFSNPNKQKVSITVAPQRKGMITLELIALKRNKTFYVCPKVEVS